MQLRFCRRHSSTTRLRRPYEPAEQVVAAEHDRQDQKYKLGRIKEHLTVGLPSADWLCRVLSPHKNDAWLRTIANWGEWRGLGCQHPHLASGGKPEADKQWGRQEVSGFL